MGSKKKRAGALTGIASFLILSVVMYVLKDQIVSAVNGVPGYVAIFLLSFIGALSVIVPIPYTALIFVLASMKSLDPVMVSVYGGLGSGLGEVTGWLVGRFMTKTLEGTKYAKQISALMKLLRSKGKYVVPLIIYIFALTPLPDDLLFIVLGVLKYNLVYALIPCVAGKMTMMYVIAVFGRAVNVVGESVGINSNVLMIATIAALAVVLAIMILIPWDKILEKYLK